MLPNDISLLEAIRKGDEQAFERPFKSCYPRLTGYATRFVEDRETAHDIVQECFLKFWEKRNLLSSLSITSLLFAMVRNACLNHLKHFCIVEKHKLEYLAKFDGEERLYHADFKYQTDERLLYDELQEQIKVVMEKLLKRCREVFLMSRFEGLKNMEIAEKLRIST